MPATRSVLMGSVLQTPARAGSVLSAQFVRKEAVSKTPVEAKLSANTVEFVASLKIPVPMIPVQESPVPAQSRFVVMDNVYHQKPVTLTSNVPTISSASAAVVVFLSVSPMAIAKKVCFVLEDVVRKISAPAKPVPKVNSAMRDNASSPVQGFSVQKMKCAWMGSASSTLVMAWNAMV